MSCSVNAERNPRDAQRADHHAGSRADQHNIERDTAGIEDRAQHFADRDTLAAVTEQ